MNKIYAIDFNVTESLIDSIKAISFKVAHAINLMYQSYKEGRQDVILENKKDLSALTKADLLSHDLIYQALKKLTPSIPIVSEELIDSHTLIKQKLFWLIDPLDGTKEFIHGTDEFTINIALIQDGQVIFGLISAPALGKTYWGSKLSGSFVSSTNGVKKISVVIPKETERLKIISSRNHSNHETEKFISSFCKNKSMHIGSSLKFCMIASGDAHIYPRFGRTCLWDTAAGQAILENAGGTVSVLSEEKLSYNQSSIYNPYFIAASIPLSIIKQYQNII